MQAEVPITRWEGDTARESVDSVVVEEPLEIRINGESPTVTMRTPGDDFALAAGLLFTEGIIRSADDIGGMAYCTDPDNPHLQNIVNVYLAGDWRPDQERGRWQRSFMATSSCGLCGKASIEAVRCFAPPIAASDFRVSVGVVRCVSGCGPRSASLPERADCTPPGCSIKRARCWCCGRMSGGTTR